jgi:hypothetical protein
MRGQVLERRKRAGPLHANQRLTRPWRAPGVDQRIRQPMGKKSRMTAAIWSDLGANAVPALASREVDAREQVPGAFALLAVMGKLGRLSKMSFPIR